MKGSYNNGVSGRKFLGVHTKNGVYIYQGMENYFYKYFSRSITIERDFLYLCICFCPIYRDIAKIKVNRLLNYGILFGNVLYQEHR